MKKYRWNRRKFAETMATLVLMTGTGLLIGYIFAMWMGGAA